MIVQLPKVIVDPRMRGMCCLAYPLHPRGCPNFAHKLGCPPKCPLFDRIVDCKKPVFAIINEYNLAEHVERMRKNNPSWSQRQLECCLYWQPTARKSLAEEIKRFLGKHPGFHVDTCPESGGVNVTETLRCVGINLEWPPRIIVRQVALVGRLLLKATCATPAK